jgi:excisionase family DNA binding protein
MNYTTTEQAGKRTGLSAPYIRKLAQFGRIEGAQRVGRAWLIPQDWTPPALKRGRPFKKEVTEMTTDKMLDLVGGTVDEVHSAFDGKTSAKIEAELNVMFPGDDNSDLADAIYKFCK